MKGRECVWLQKMGFFWAVAAAVLATAAAVVLAAAAVLTGSKKGREKFCGVRMKRERVSSKDIVLFIPRLFILQSLQ